MRELNVLIVDDEVPIRQDLNLFPWKEHGFKLVGEAKNGKEALTICQALNPDIVVTDIMMPFMDGLQLTRALKEWRQLIQIILLSCHNDFDFVRQALLLGASDYLLKGTYRDEDLLQTLNKVREKFIEVPEPKSKLSVRFEIQEAITFIHNHIHEHIQLGDVAAHVRLSVNYLGILFRKEMGTYFQDYVKRMRMERAAELLKNSNMKVYEISEKVGIPNYRYFVELFYDYYKQTPKEYRGSK